MQNMCVYAKKRFHADEPLNAEKEHRPTGNLKNENKQFLSLSTHTHTHTHTHIQACGGQRGHAGDYR